MMSADKEILYWMENDDWSTDSEDGKSIVLTELAPERARKSFELWSKGWPEMTAS